jgi:hypothetical protein
VIWLFFVLFFSYFLLQRAPNGARFSDTLGRIADVFFDVPEVTSPSSQVSGGVGS